MIPPLKDMPEIIFSLLLFQLIPFSVGTLLPAFIIPMAVKKIIKATSVTQKELFTFSIVITSIALIMWGIWELFVFKHIYYEWDRIFFPYTLLFYETPILDGSPSWLTKGWTFTGFRTLWLTFTIPIYFIAGAFVLYQNKHIKHIKQYLKLIAISISVLSILSLCSTTIISYFISLIPFLQ